MEKKLKELIGFKIKMILQNTLVLMGTLIEVEDEVARIDYDREEVRDGEGTGKYIAMSNFINIRAIYSVETMRVGLTHKTVSKTTIENTKQV
jgi:hypothetical protein